MIGFYESKRKNGKVVKVNDKPKKGFYIILDNSMDGYSTIRQNIIEDQYRECTEDYYKKFKTIYEKAKRWK